MREAAPRRVPRLLVPAALVFLAAAVSGPEAPLPAPAEAQSADVFGQGVLTVEGRPARGVRQALVVLMEFRDERFDSAHTADFYRRFVSGTSFPNVSDYYREQSRGRFTVSARVVGPFTHPDLEGTRADESLLNCATRRKWGGACPARPDTTGSWYDGNWMRVLTTSIRVAADSGGVDFAAYDLDADGRVGPDELVVVMVGAEPPGTRFREAGATRSAWPRACVSVPGQDVEVCTRSSEGVRGMSSFGEAVDLDTFLHELTHTLGAVDLYGSGFRMNSGLTLMASTIGGPEDQRGAYHLDPWHKMALGWTTPRIRSVRSGRAGGVGSGLASRDGEACVGLRGVRPGAPPTEGAGRAVLLHDSVRTVSGPREFYLLEARHRAGYDANVADTSGVALWYVQLGDDRTPRFLPSRIAPGPDGKLQTQPAAADTVIRNSVRPGPDGILQTAPAGDDIRSTDALDFVVGPDAPGGPTAYAARGRGGLWREADGIADLRWLDGSAVGVSFRVVDASAGEPHRYTVDLAPRTLEITPPKGRPTVRRGDPLYLHGHLGAPAGRVVRIWPADRESTRRNREVMDVESWSCDEVRVRVPTSLRTGVHLVEVRDTMLGISSGRIEVDVGPSSPKVGAWAGVREGRIDGRRARLTIRHGGEIPTLRIRLEDLERGGVFTGSVPAPTGSSWYVLRDLRLRSSDGGERVVGALHLQHKADSAGIAGWTPWRGDRYGMAFGGGVALSAADGPNLERSSAGKRARQWAGRYRGVLGSGDAALTVVPERVTDAVSTFRVTVVFDFADFEYSGTGTVLSGEPHQMRFGRPLGGSGGIRLHRILLHTWDTEVLSAFGSRGPGRSISGHFIQTGHPGGTEADSGAIRPEVPIRPDLPVRPLRGEAEADAGSCAAAVQGKIAWNYEEDTRWAEANVRRLCRGAEDTVEPARCFQWVMHGGVDWGGGTRWRWRNALSLCRGSRDADRSVACFRARIADGAPWQRAIEACGGGGR